MEAKKRVFTQFEFCGIFTSGGGGSDDRRFYQRMRITSLNRFALNEAVSALIMLNE